MDHIERSPQAEKNPLKNLIVAVWFLCGVRGSFQNDTWWHLATGRSIWNNKTLPLVDTFSWVTGANTYWPNHEWLTELCMYLLYSVGGATLMHILCGTLFALTACMIWRASNSNSTVTFLSMLLLLPWVATGAAVRPHVLSMVFIAILLLLLKQRRYFFVPPLFLIWAQMHGGVCIGGALLVMWTVGCVLFERSYAFRAMIVTVLSGAAVVVNPIGVDLFYHPLRSTAVSRTLPLIEWAPPFSFPVLGTYYGVVVLLLTIGASITLVKGTVPQDRIHSLVTLTLLPLTCVHARTVALLMPVIVIGVLIQLQHVPRIAAIRLTLSALVARTLVVLLLLTTAVSVAELRDSPTERPISEVGASMIEEAPARFFNTYDTGGYLIWFTPRQKVFIDSRQDPYPQQLLEEAIMVQNTGEFQQFFENFGIRSAVVERHFPLHRALKNAGWTIRYRSPLFDLLIAPQINPKQN